MRTLRLAVVVLAQLILLAFTVNSRVLTDGVVRDEESISSHDLIQMVTVPEESCEQMYGFLPCSKNIWGHVFLIVVYEYLLFHGESYVAAGGERIFKILGPGVFGACAFQIIGCLPEALILLASGLLNNKEVAHECVITGVGLLAGTSILLLTIVWGTCVILGSQDFSKYLKLDSSSSCHSEQNPAERLLLSLWPSYGIVTDSWTSYSANLMLLSVIPLIMIQFLRFFHFSLFWEQMFIVITLIVTVAFLLSYFFYQLFQPWIQKRQLLYLKHGHLVADILKHMQNHTMGELFSDDGAPNMTIIRRIFEESDKDQDNTLGVSELKDFLRDIKFQNLYSDKGKAAEEMMKDFDMDNSQKITIDEFVKGIEKWIEQTKKDTGHTYHLKEVIEPWIQKKREEREVLENLIPEVLKYFRTSLSGSLLAANGKPDIPSIKRLFKDIDKDHDDTISYSELKNLVMNIGPHSIHHDTDTATSKLMEELDISGDQFIDENEFVIGFSKWLETTQHKQIQVSGEGTASDYNKHWEQTDEIVEDKLIDKTFFAWTKALSLVVIGITMLGLLAEPLIHSVQSLSKAANVSSFFIAFIFVPLATNARIAISAITEVRRKKLKINSLTFSELYGTVLMNNLLGLIVLLSLTYFRGLSWNFSTEVLVVLIVCIVIGGLASFNTIFPVWTSMVAFLLYPLSLVVVVFFGDFNWLSGGVAEL